MLLFHLVNRAVGRHRRADAAGQPNRNDVHQGTARIAYLVPQVCSDRLVDNDPERYAECLRASYAELAAATAVA